MFAPTTGAVPPLRNAVTGTPGVSFPEIISALSYALDLTEDAVPGHAIRSCLLGMRIAAELGLSSKDQANLYYALLLKDSGCSNNASRMCTIIGGDDRYGKTGAKLEDWTRPHRPTWAGVSLLWRSVLPGARPDKKISRMLRVAFTQHRNNREMIALRCSRGAEIARKLGLTDATAEAVRCLDEHWDGHGYPDRRARENVPMLSRIAAVAQHLDIFSTERHPEFAMRVLHDRSGRWFDPEIVKVVDSLHRQGTLWQNCLATREPGATGEKTRIAQDNAALQSVLDLDPDPLRQLDPSAVDNICTAFADVVDAKSPFTFHHSIKVTEVADSLARVMGLQEDRKQLIHRAALLHDIGKLRVPNTILDKQGPLNAEERQVIEEHPLLTQQILGRVGAFDELARVAGAHHERLDGSGYPYRLTGAELSLEARLLAVADVFSALTEDRPYRESVPIDQVITLMQKDVPRKLDARCFEALVTVIADAPAGAADLRSHSAEPRPLTWGHTTAARTPVSTLA
jgi:putative nucleotidyltransferase with HDIG domain